MRKETKNSLVGLVLFITITTISVVMFVKYAPHNSHSRSIPEGKYDQNNNTQPAWSKLELGMTKTEVQEVWGNRMNDTFKHNRTGTQEKWYYSCHLNKCLILTFENDSLTQWEG